MQEKFLCEAKAVAFSPKGFGLTDFTWRESLGHA